MFNNISMFNNKYISFSKGNNNWVRAMDGFLRKKKRDDVESWEDFYKDQEELEDEHSMWTAKIKEKILKKLGLC